MEKLSNTDQSKVGYLMIDRQIDARVHMTRVCHSNSHRKYESESCDDQHHSEFMT